jgi:hypothetical protein
MSERWKYQLKMGGFWGVFMTIFSSLFTLKEHSFSQQLSAPTFYIRMAVFLLLGIFGLGYFNWRAMQKQKQKE